VDKRHVRCDSAGVLNIQCSAYSEYRDESQIYWEIHLLKKGISLKSFRSAAFPGLLGKKGQHLKQYQCCYVDKMG